MSVYFEPPVYNCDRCIRTFDKLKIVQGIYGTRHCNNCMNELRNHEIRERVASWTIPSDLEDNSIPIRDLISNV
uniref:Uncharacterized protein n=1 Tax=viral metagenome TaxID=1070528 RepID=A0A6C0B930_9ZZZZ